MHRSEVRLLTLVGPPGVGKTRLAMQAAVELQSSFADGVCFVSLAAAHSFDFVPDTIARSLGVREHGGSTIGQALASFLREKHLLLVLDNLEQLAAACAPLTSLLHSAPRLKLLCTSRVVLHLDGEHSYRVQPLALPEPEAHTHLDEIAESPAVALFMARATHHSFALTPETAEPVVRLCRRLDGLPLALELAAVQLRLLSIGELLTHLDDALRAVADFVDLRLPMTSGHSTAVAALCVWTGRHLGLGDAELAALRRAAYLHDLGTASVSVSVWEKTGPLNADEWERVRLHPYYTERVLMRAPALAPLGRIAALHHEHLDGSGYHRQCVAPQMNLAARLLAAAEAYCGMREPRAHRPALSPDQAAAELRAAARGGRLDGVVVEAVLASAGHRAPARRVARPAGLSTREVEVLVLLARGLMNREIAARLVIASATVDHHIRHIYTKIGCSTRIAATLFAMEQQMIG